MKKFNLSELKVKSKSGKSKTRKRRKRQNLFSKFSILVIGPKSKSRKKISRKKISEISNVSDFSQFSTWPFFSLFSSKAIFFFSIYTNLNKFESGKIRVDHIVLFKKMMNFLKSSYGSNYLVFSIIAYSKKYLQSDWLRVVQYWPYLYSIFNMCTLWLNKKKKHNIRILSRKK